MFELTVQDFNGEPRMRDLDIADALGFRRTRDIRQLINRCLDHLAGYGQIICGAAPHIKRRGRDPKEYWLNEHQAFYLCTQSTAQKADEVTQQIIRVFVDWRNGRLSPPPQPEPSPKLNVTPDMVDIKALVAEARLTFGRAAGQILWRKMGMPDLPADDAPIAEVAPDDVTDPILLFLQEECVVTGEARHWIRSRDLHRAYLAFCNEIDEPALTIRGFGVQVIALAREYSCPDSGKKFRRQKRSDTGFCGIHLISRTA